ncbi:MAG: hypothetical protein JSS65_03700 [Armatimonadetes bacterium]|nr:hypothetical protein [Armatimonadota bacterium]
MSRIGTFNNCIAIGVPDKVASAEQFARLFGGEVTSGNDEYSEVTVGPYRFYFVEDGTDDIAFSIDVEDAGTATQALVAEGFVIDEKLTSTVGEPFVRGAGRILINVFEGKS